MKTQSNTLGKGLGLAAVITASAALFVAAGQASASLIPFNFTGSLQFYTIPVTGQYDLMAFGAGGGTGGLSGLNTGGSGAQIGGRFTLTAGTVLTVLVGERGISDVQIVGGGGGGASAVYIAGDAFPLVMAGGGGGGAGLGPVAGQGLWGVATRSGAPGESAASAGGLGGVNGFGGGADGAL